MSLRRHCIVSKQRGSCRSHHQRANGPTRRIPRAGDRRSLAKRPNRPGPWRLFCDKKPFQIATRAGGENPAGRSEDKLGRLLMKITAVEAFPVTVPMRIPYITALTRKDTSSQEKREPMHLSIFQAGHE